MTTLNALKTMQLHLTDAGFDFVEANDRWVIVQDPKWLNYRVYSATDNPENYTSAWVDAPHYTFEWINEAVEFAGIE